ncbi:MAG: dUTP diphosphatase [Bifidobacteriaceae bacterium]|jgi:dUTP pyrophosphatase|nr:dUTP diphosphatase [Bifidobacteriaceae bacterium]
MIIPFKKIHPDAKLPLRAKSGDAGADLYSVESVKLKPFSSALVHTGLVGAIPEGYVGLIHPRSGLALKRSITVLNAPGTVDSGYRGEFCIILYNASDKMQELEKGERIAQLVIQKVELPTFEETQNLPDSDRGESGFGSTGEK